MALRGLRHDHPTYLARQQINWTGAAGAGGVQGRYLAVMKLRLRKALVKVITAGTTAGNGIVIHNVSGTTTTSVGTVAVSTDVANSSLSTADLNATFNAGDMILIVNGTDATGVKAGAIEFEFLPDAQVTV